MNDFNKSTRTTGCVGAPWNDGDKTVLRLSAGVAAGFGDDKGPRVLGRLRVVF